MSFIRYKKLNGKLYAYEILAYWDKEQKRSRQKSIYLGRVDEATNQIIGKLIKTPKGQEKLILDFGDGYFLNELIKGSNLYPILKAQLFDHHPELVPLIIYRICTGSAMYNCQNWLEGNVLNVLFKNPNLSSQRISELLVFLGDERVQRNFFTEYLKLIGGSNKSVIIDATSLPNQIDIDFNAWGYADGRIDKQFKLLCAVDQDTKLPLFYRFLPGNISDVTTLKTTMNELESMGVKNSLAFLDAGYFSKANISDLYERKINFLTRLPANLTLYKEVVLQQTREIESLSNAQTSGNRNIFTKEVKVDLFGNEGYAYMILDPQRKGKEINELLAKVQQEKIDDPTAYNEKKYELAFATCGVFILVSSIPIPVNDVLSCYHIRMYVEQIFRFSKTDLDLLPIRHHNDDTVRGYLFLQFLQLILFIQAREKIHKKYTVEQAIMTLQKLKCKVFDKEVFPQEVSKEQRDILDRYQIIVPIKLGI